MLQRPQLRKIWIQEYLAGSERYAKVIRPKIKHLHETLSLPYFNEVVQLGIVKRFTPQEIALVWSSVVLSNLAYPYFVELQLGLPTGTPKSVETQVDLLFAILVADPDDRDTSAPASPSDIASGRFGAPRGEDPNEAAGASRSVVYAWENAKELTPAANRIKQLEHENLQLKQLVGTLSLEKKLLLDRLGALERGAAEP